MRKIYWVIILLVTVPAQLFSQQRKYVKKPSPKYDFSKGTQFVRLNVTNFLDPVDLSISSGYVYHLTEQVSIASDAGIYVYSRYYNNTKGVFGFQFRPAIRYYTAPSGNFYLEFETMYKQLTHRLHDFLGREFNGTVAAYEELTDFKYRRSIFSGAVKFGLLTHLDNNKKVFLDIYAGIGLRTKKFKLLNEPNSVYRRDASFFNTDSENTIYPSIPFGIRLAYRIK